MTLLWPVMVLVLAWTSSAWAAPVFVTASHTGAGSTTTTPTISFVGNVQAGSLLLASLHSQSGGAGLSSVAGSGAGCAGAFTILVSQTSAGDAGVHLAYRTADA